MENRDKPMEALKRLELETRQHRKQIDGLFKSLNHEKSEMKRVLKRIEGDESGNDDQQNYGLVYAHSDVICRTIKSIKELQELLLIKLDTIVRLTPNPKGGKDE